MSNSGNPLGREIESLRKTRGLTQENLQELANLGNASNVSRAESGKILPTFANMRAMAIALGAESNLMAIYLRALEEDNRRKPASEFTVAIPDCLLAAPVAFLGPEFRFATIDEREWRGLDQEEIAAMREEVHCAVLPGLRDSSPANGSGISKDAFPVASLICEFSSDAIDIVWQPKDKDSLRWSSSLTDNLDEVLKRTFPVSGLGSVPKALLASGQLGESKNESGRDVNPDNEEPIRNLVLEPFTSKLLGEHDRGAQAPARADSRRLRVEFHFLTDSGYAFDDLRSQMSFWVGQVADRVELLNTSDTPSVAAIAEAFEVSEELVRNFMKRAAPKWSLGLLPVWLQGRRNV
jgi:transcriptional regulator with XRE-family HTH domain